MAEIGAAPFFGVGRKEFMDPAGGPPPADGLVDKRVSGFRQGAFQHAFVLKRGIPQPRGREPPPDGFEPKGYWGTKTASVPQTAAPGHLPF